ncbi:hypothetical protein B0H14DRAFT_2393108, partial [Mycena olivaceomarginata]
QCLDCTGYAMSCQQCFVEAHRQNPFHWAEVWDTLEGLFIQHDISKLGHIIQLGSCPSPCGEQLFTVVDGNGIHSTRLSFCGCYELPPNKMRQLMRSRLFPATTREPEASFTINRQVAQTPLEPPHGIFAVRKRVAPLPKNDVNGCEWLEWLVWSHSPAILAHGPGATEWPQWLVRNLSNMLKEFQLHNV